MKYKLTITVLACALLAPSIYGITPTKPSIMVVPADAWCINNKFTKTISNQGETIEVVDYYKAFQNSSELSAVITKIGTLFSERGFNLKDMASALVKLKKDEAENSMTTSKTGNTLLVSDLDKVRNVVKSDIRLVLDYTITKSGPKSEVTFNIKAIDNYTSEQIGGAVGVGNPSFETNVDKLVLEAVLSHMENLQAGMQKHFDELLLNGRMVRINIRVYESNESGLDLESTFKNDSTYQDIIRSWLSKNTINHSFKVTEETENLMIIDPARIAMFDSNDMPLDARNYIRKLEIHLEKYYGLKGKVKISRSDLGEVTIILG